MVPNENGMPLSCELRLLTFDMGVRSSFLPSESEFLHSQSGNRRYERVLFGALPRLHAPPEGSPCPGRDVAAVPDPRAATAHGASCLAPRMKR